MCVASDPSRLTTYGTEWIPYTRLRRVQILAARGEPFSDHISFVQLPLIDSRHPRVWATNAQLDWGTVPDDFEPLISEIARALQAVLRDGDVLIAHGVHTVLAGTPARDILL